MSVSITPNPNVQGPQGLTGSQGTTGAQGTTGLQGTNGATGAQGTTGAQGLTGTQGLTGSQGLTGAQGTQGIAGPTVSGTFNAQTTAYTLVAGDLNKWVTMNAATSQAITIPQNTFSAGNVIYVQRIGAGAVPITQGTGTTITSNGATSSAPNIRAQYSAATILCTASNVFTVVGDIS